MQTFQIVALIVSVLFGGGGIVAWYRVHKESKVGLSGVEVQDKAATTADWNALSAYWQSEMKELRDELKSHRKETDAMSSELQQLRKEQAYDAEHIDVLERWIYEGKPPPPPARTKRDSNPKA